MTKREEKEQMDKTIWHGIFKRYISDFNAIDRLQSDHIIDADDVASLKNKLLVDIIVTMKSEVED